MKSYSILILILNIITIFSLKCGIVQGIIGARQVELTNRGYQISIQTNDKHICGGVLISDLHALSAANCFIGDDGLFIDTEYNIVGGVNNLNDNNRIVALVDKISVPKEYHRHNNQFVYDTDDISPLDIAVLKFTEKLHFTQMSRMSIVKLPVQGIGIMTYLKNNVFVTGFGIESRKDNDPSIPVKDICHDRCYNLREAETIVLHRKKCEGLLTKKLHQHHLCGTIIQGSRKDAIAGLCYGDVGAPLVADDTIIGILIKHRTDCNESSLPSIYTSIISLQYFIEKAQEDVIMKDFIRFAKRKSWPVRGMAEIHNFM